jgi:hypothetical protein
VVITRIVVPDVPAVAREPCRRPTAIPQVPRLSQRDAVAIMLRDRAALTECESKRAAAVAAIDGARQQ